MRRLGYVLALAVVGGGTALADLPTHAKSEPATGETAASGADRSFVDQAAAGGMAEVKLSRLAMDRAQSMQVKQFARKMVEDHTKANMELKQIADKKGITPPTTFDDKHQAAYDKLGKLHGPEFDQEYMRIMTEDHDQTVQLMKNEAQSGQDPQLKSFAMKTLPIIEKHDDLAHTDADAVNAAGGMMKK